MACSKRSHTSIESAELYAEDRDLLRAIFVLTFEAIKATSPAGPRIRMWLERAADMVEAGLRKGIADGSVRPDIEIDRAVNDFGAAVLGTAYQWIMQAYPYDMAQEMAYVRGRAHSRLRSPARRAEPLGLRLR